MTFNEEPHLSRRYGQNQSTILTGTQLRLALALSRDLELLTPHGRPLKREANLQTVEDGLLNLSHLLVATSPRSLPTDRQRHQQILFVIPGFLLHFGVSPNTKRLLGSPPDPYPCLRELLLLDN